MRPRCPSLLALLTLGLLLPRPAAAKAVVLDAGLHHLRAGDRREWAEFPARAEGPSLTVRFRAGPNDGEWALRLRQQDVKQPWRVLLNGKELGRLLADENDMALWLAVPAGRLEAGENVLRVEAGDREPDDIRVGELTLDDRPVARVLTEATVEVTVREAGRDGKTAAAPCRVTVLNKQGALVALGAASGPGRAVRPGVVYTADGRARFGLPAGDYTVHAGRGFEYGVASAALALRPGDVARQELVLRRQVPTEGWVSCDTHVHSLTWSGHGDATADERVVAIAGEGVELPVATEHNRQVDYHAAAVRQGVRGWFTPVVGNEVTTAVGHFNVFPAPAGGRVPDFQVKDWSRLGVSIAERTAAPVVVLNHPYDLHAGFRPFGPERHLALTGERLDGRELPANALEVVNSGAQQSDVLRPYRAWFGLLFRGLPLTPVGASDSHDVSRYIVGQGRTYVRCRDDRPGHIDVAAAVKSLREGRVLVSCGLLAEITVNGKYGPGDLAPAPGEVRVKVRVLGPDWVTAEKVELYANGHKLREARVTDGKRAGVKWEEEWRLPRFRHDAWLAAVASGPGVRELYWPIAKPYQPTSPVVERRVLGATGAVWLDADGDGKRTSAREYAERLWREADGKWPGLVKALGGYDEAVAAQAPSLLRARGTRPDDAAVLAAAANAGPQVERAFQAYREAWRECEIARGQSR
jgi:hypothetical protein